MARLKITPTTAPVIADRAAPKARASEFFPVWRDERETGRFGLRHSSRKGAEPLPRSFRWDVTWRWCHSGGICCVVASTASSAEASGVLYQPLEAQGLRRDWFGEDTIFPLACRDGRFLLSGIGARSCWTSLPNRRSRTTRIPTLRDLHVFNRDSRERQYDWHPTRHRT